MSERPMERDIKAEMSPAATTAGHMAEAVGYLVWVATEANMRKVATRLAQIRVELLLLADEGDANGDWQKLTPPN
jgi:hypothetical protein